MRGSPTHESIGRVKKTNIKKLKIGQVKKCYTYFIIFVLVPIGAFKGFRIYFLLVGINFYHSQVEKYYLYILKVNNLKEG